MMMCNLKLTLCAAVAGLSLLQGQPANALNATSADDQLRVFATCAGRLSALLEHQWTFDAAASDATTAEVNAMADLVAALTTPDVGEKVFSWRLNAKVAHMQLLRRAYFGTDMADAAWAAEMADANEAACRDLLL